MLIHLNLCRGGGGLPVLIGYVSSLPTALSQTVPKDLPNQAGLSCYGERCGRMWNVLHENYVS